MTLVELLVVLGLFSILSLAIHTVTQEMQASARHVEDVTLRGEAAQRLAFQLADELRLALPAGHAAPLSWQTDDQGVSSVAYDVAVVSATPHVRRVALRHTAATQDEQGRPGGRRLVRTATGPDSEYEPDERLLGLAERTSWDYQLTLSRLDPARNATSPGSHEQARLPEAVEVRVVITNLATRHRDARPALGLAVARLHNAGVVQ